MRYLRVQNWKNHQHRDLADKGNMPWFKVDSGIFDNPVVAGLTSNEFRAYIRSLVLAARTGNKLPANPTWLRTEFGRSWRPLCERLVAVGLLEGRVPDPARKDKSGAEVVQKWRNIVPPLPPAGPDSPKESLQTAALRRGKGAPLPRLEEKRREQTLEATSTGDVAARIIDPHANW